MHIYSLTQGPRSAQMSSLAHMYTLTHTLAQSYISNNGASPLHRMPCINLFPRLLSLFFLCLPFITFISLCVPYLEPLVLPLSAYLSLSPLHAVCPVVMELICLAHKECPSISAGPSVQREMVTNRTNVFVSALGT